MTLPTFDFGSDAGMWGPSGVYPGWKTFLSAPIADFSPSPQVAWAANPLLWLAVVLVLINRGGLWSIAFAALAVACGAVGVIGWLQTPRGASVDVLTGVYVWLASFALAAVGVSMLRSRPNEVRRARTPSDG